MRSRDTQRSIDTFDDASDAVNGLGRRKVAMGTMSWDRYTVEFEDRLLTHLQIVVVNKFRRGESFLMSWIESTSGSGRSSVWLTPETATYFKFSGSRVPSVDEAWLRLLNDSAARSTGLIVSDDQGRPVRAGGPPRARPEIRRPELAHPGRTAPAAR